MSGAREAAGSATLRLRRRAGPAAVLLALVLLAAAAAIGLALKAIADEVSDAVVLDVAGRQRMLNQLHFKQVLLASMGREVDLETTRSLFKDSVAALRNGGPVLVDRAGGEIAELPAETDPELRLELEAQAAAMALQIRTAEALLAVGRQEPRFEELLSELEKRSDALGRRLENTVLRLEQRAAGRVRRSLRWTAATAVLMLITAVGLFWQSRRIADLGRQVLEEERRGARASRHLDAVVNSVADGILTVDRRGALRSLNPAAEAIFGYASAEVAGLDLRTLLAGPDQGATRPDLEALLRAGRDRPQDKGTRLSGKRRDGSTFPLDLIVTETSAGGQPLFVAVARDVSAEEAAVAALRQSEERFQLAVEGSAAGIWDWDLRAERVWYSPRFKRLLGYSGDDFPDVLDSVLEHLHPEDREAVEAGFEAHFRNREPYDMEHRFRLKSGDYRWFRSRGRALFDEHGKPLRMAGSIIDVSQRREAEEALRRSEERFQLAVAGSTDGLWDWDVVTGEVWYAPRFKQMLGYRDEEFPNVFDSFDSHLHPDDREATLERVRQHLEERRPYDVEYRLRDRDGHWRWFRARGQALWRDDGTPFRMAGSISDVTDRKLAEQALVAAKEEAEAANEAKSRFLANMSHELRTPLNAIIGYSELLEEEVGSDDSEQLIDDLRKIRGAGKQLLGLINDVLDLSKVEAGRIELMPETFDLAAALGDAAATVEPLFEQSGNRLDTAGLTGSGEVTLDRSRLRQIVLNLLSNANKFTNRGEVVLSCHRESAAGGDQVVIEVADNGIGMTPQQMKHIFQPFAQGDSSTTRQYGGTGLGLSISSRLCEMMGGEIGVASEPGRGSTFTVRLPAAAVSGAAARPAVPAERGQVADTVVVIDDDPATLDLMSRLLEKEGFAVATAASGADGIELARQLRPMAITLDVMMPSLDGWSVLTRLKEDPELGAIPVVLVTMIDDRPLGFALGAADYLLKPVDRRLLSATLGRFRRRARPGSVLVVDDDVDVREMIGRTLSAEGWEVIEAADGREALDRLEEALPDVILLDLMMPRMDGFELLDRLRRRPGLDAVPVVVLTAKSLDSGERTRLAGSVQRILEKGSYSREELLAEVARQMHRYSRPARDGSPAARENRGRTE